MLDIQQTAFDWASLDTDTHWFVREKTDAIKARMKRTAEDVIAIGQDLLAVKERLVHGQFMGWVDSEFGMKRQTAQNFMLVAERFGGELPNFGNFPVTVLYALAAPSMPEPIIEQVLSGQLPASLPAIREAKAALRSPEPEPDLPPETVIIPRDELARLENIETWAQKAGYYGEDELYGAWGDAEGGEDEPEKKPAPITPLYEPGPVLLPPELEYVADAAQRPTPPEIQGSRFLSLLSDLRRLGELFNQFRGLGEAEISAGLHLLSPEDQATHAALLDMVCNGATALRALMQPHSEKSFTVVQGG